jgi:hypothetical protein
VHVSRLIRIQSSSHLAHGLDLMIQPPGEGWQSPSTVWRG